MMSWRLASGAAEWPRWNVRAGWWGGGGRGGWKVGGQRTVPAGGTRRSGPFPLLDGSAVPAAGRAVLSALPLPPPRWRGTTSCGRRAAGGGGGRVFCFCSVWYPSSAASRSPPLLWLRLCTPMVAVGRPPRAASVSLPPPSPLPPSPALGRCRCHRRCRRRRCRRAAAAHRCLLPTTCTPYVKGWRWPRCWRPRGREREWTWTASGEAWAARPTPAPTSTSWDWGEGKPRR